MAWSSTPENIWILSLWWRSIRIRGASTACSIPFSVAEASEVLHRALDLAYRGGRLTLAGDAERWAEALCGQRLLYRPATQVSAYYRIRLGERQEDHCSSGIIVSTGAGSTGWLRAVLAGAAGVAEQLAARVSDANGVALLHVPTGTRGGACAAVAD